MYKVRSDFQLPLLFRCVVLISGSILASSGHRLVCLSPLMCVLCVYIGGVCVYVRVCCRNSLQFVVSMIFEIESLEKACLKMNRFFLLSTCFWTYKVGVCVNCCIIYLCSLFGPLFGGF